MSRRGSGCIQAVLAAAAFGIGCEDRPDVVIRGRRVAIAPYFDAPVCAGSVAEFDHFVEAIEADSGLRGPRITTIYWGVEAVGLECPDGDFGCSRPEKAEVYGLYASMQHELAHVVGDDVGRAELFVEEGFAVSHDSTICTSVDFGGGIQLIDYVGKAADEFARMGGYAVAGHFATYLGRRYGASRWSALKERVPLGSTREEFQSAFAEIYGRSLDDAELLWWAEAPPVTCPGPSKPTLLWTGEPLVIGHALDCGDVSTFGPLDQTISYFPSFTDDDIVEVMYSRDRLLVPLVDRWLVEFDGPLDARAVLRSRDCIANSAANPEQEHEIIAGEKVVLDVDACDYLVLLTAPPDSPGDVELRIERAPEGT